MDKMMRGQEYSFYDKGSDASKKKREKRTFLAADSEIDIEFLELDIRKFCPKRIFDIIVINEVEFEAQEAMNVIINSGRKYEDVSCVTFIKYSEVILLLDRFDYSILPDSIRTMVEQVLEETKLYLSVVKPERIPVLKMAILVKIKLIEMMIRHYKRELDRMETRKILTLELESLTKANQIVPNKNAPPPPPPPPAAEIPKRESAKKSKIQLGTSGLETLDTESDVIFDDDIFNHVWFYALEGFYNAKVLNVLITSKVPITAIIKIDLEGSLYSATQDSMFTKFWNELDEVLFSHTRLEIYENTMLLQFTIKGEDHLDIFQDLLYTIKNISEIKFQHLNYIRHINVYQMDHIYNNLPIHCMHTYNKLMSSIPLELASEVVVLSSILEETCIQLDGENLNDKYSLDDDLSQTSNTVCPDPRKNTKLEQISQDTKNKDYCSIQCYHKDVLGRVLYMYKPAGKLVYDLSINVLKNIYPLNLLESVNYKEDVVIHKHDIDPSNKQVNKDNLEVFNHFINLFIFCTFSGADTDIKPYEKTKFTEILCTYDNVAFNNNLRPKIDDQTTHKDSGTYFDLHYNVNPMDYYWKENYSPIILMQELYNGQFEFSYIDATYCPETDRLLVQFSDWLDEFGINTKIYDETLLTPVCLRDFCRYTAREVESWLQENPPTKYVRKSEEAEKCKGARKLRKQDIFEEYRYLLETDPFSSSDAPTISVMSYNPPQENNNVKEVTFDEMMLELETYPSNNKLKEEYSKQEYSKDFLAYDFGTKYFALRGARTIFASHDNVKLTVENDKFIDENSKCTVNLKYKNNNMILHSTDSFRNFYSFHWILGDDTIVVFEIQKKSRKITKTVEPENTEVDLDKMTMADETEKPKIDIGKIKVKNINEENLESVFKQPITKETIREQSHMNIFEGLQQAIEKNCPVYKINKGYETLKMIKPVDDIPIATIIQRVLHNAEKDKKRSSDESRPKRYVPLKTPISNLTVVESATFRVTLPNGIYLTCYPSQIKETLIEVKQEVLSQDIKSLRTEEFRLFTREGYILIKKVDGSITILMSNGNKLDFEKPDSEKEEIRGSNLKQGHCKTVNDYRKKLNKLMKNYGRNDDAYYISRRGALETKRGYIINKDIIKMLENTKLPYLKSSLLNFDGTKTVLEGNKISQKQLFYTVSENDFCKEEIYYERKDGFKCILQRTAAKTVEYPDGTRITTTVTVANELVDGYVYITLYYKYEHPLYATVAYSEGDLLQVVLNNVIIEKSKDNTCTLKMDDETTTTIDTENVIFTKTCSKCEIPYRCVFNISPFHNNYLDFTKQFVHAEDSYIKHFFVDFSGVCRINKNYITGSLNSANCNHILQNIYKKLFAIKRTMSGEEFFTENMVNTYSEKQTEKEDIEITKKGKSHPILKFKFSYYRPFTDRFLSNSFLDSSVTLTKYQQSNERTLYYSTVKLLCEIINAHKVEVLLLHLIDQFNNIDIDNKTRQLVKWLASKKEDEANLKRREILKKQEEILKEEAKKCKCFKDKKTFARKILQWGDECARMKKMLKDKFIPNYFHSDFCLVTRKRR